MSSTRDSGDEEKSALTSTSFVLSALFLVGMVVAAVVLAATGPARGTAATPSTTTARAMPQATTTPIPVAPVQGSAGAAQPAAPPADSTTPAAASVCGLRAAALVVPSTAPAGSWQIVAGIAVPTSPVFGPARLVGGIGSCYTHDPTGALFAMMDTLALTEAPSDQIPAAAVVAERGSHSGQYVQALAAAESQDAAAGSTMPSDPSTTPKVTLLGFRFVDYTPDRATIAVAVGVGDPSLSSTYQPAMLTAVVTWERGDWKFVYSDQTGATAAPIISTEQYTAWAA